jgi:hypothetical protein
LKLHVPSNVIRGSILPQKHYPKYISSIKKKEKRKKSRSKRRLLVSALENYTRENWIKSTRN